MSSLSPTIITPSYDDLRLEIISKWSPPDLMSAAIRAHHARGSALSGLGPTLVENKSEADLYKFLLSGGEMVQVFPAGHSRPTGGFLVVSGFDMIKDYYDLSLENDRYLKNFDGPILGCFSNIPEPGTGRFGTRNNANAVKLLSKQRQAIAIGNVLCENKIVAPQMSSIGGVVIRLQPNKYRLVPEWIFALRPDITWPIQNNTDPEDFLGIDAIKQNFDYIQSTLLSGEKVGLVSRHGTHLSLVDNPIG